MRRIEHIYIDGRFATPHGEEWFDLFNPATEQVIGQVRLADAEDACLAIDAARRALPAMARTGVDERLDMLGRMQAAMERHHDELLEAVRVEYGAPYSRSTWMTRFASDVIGQAMTALRGFAFEQQAGSARVLLQPVGVAGLITPWNSDAGFICGKLAMALAAGCTAVIKPSEMSAWQTEVVARALHEAQLPPGVFNIVTGRGEVVGAAIASSPHVAKISFTGSGMVGKAILRASADTLKRVTLELGGKSPSIVLDDADPATVVPQLVAAGFINSGQACIAGTRILVPAARLAEYEAAIAAEVAKTRSGDPADPDTAIGPMVSARQWERVQRYIRTGLEEGARLLAGGEGRPDGMTRGWCVRPTVFTDVRSDMTIAREEIFGPVLCVLPYRDEEEAIALANDTAYGLNAWVFTADTARGQALAARIESGRVLVNTLAHEPQAPFGGMKQSGLGRENGRWGLESFLEAKTVLVG
ncbi:MAG TPA: aldehyde dehydrogenase family protein [Xanthomonadaceae bacterium]|nr:aldehyde dehydrogenase family protein [Xanthomonadaceae bacterium]